MDKGQIRDRSETERGRAVLGILGLELAPTRTRKGTGPSPALMKRMAQRYVWWQPPEASVADPRRVIAQVMDVGTLEDIQALAKAVGRNAWHTVLGLATAGRIPPIPARPGAGGRWKPA